MTLCWLAVAAMSQNVTLKAVNQPAATVFREIMEQTGKNFVYSSELLTNLKVSVDVRNKPLKRALMEMFGNTDIKFKINGNNVILKRKPTKTREKEPARTQPVKSRIKLKSPTIKTALLDEVVVVSRLEAPAVETAEIGARKVTPEEIRNTPSLFGEADVIKTLQNQPGVTAGTEGLAGMHVHGGNVDENLCMLDNVPLYQTNHFAGLFSAFNTDLIRHIDFFKSSVPAKYDGRLSSFMDVRLKNGDTEGHHGSARIGLTSGAFNISGPIGSKTTYIAGIRRSWFDLLTIPLMAIVNSSQEEKSQFIYYFTDINAKVSHRFSDSATAFASVYFGNDLLKTSMKDDGFDSDFNGSVEHDKYNYHWGNIVAQTGLNWRISPCISAEFTAAYTRFFSSMKHHDVYKTNDGPSISTTIDHAKTNNNVNDWIFRGDFEWRPNNDSRVRFGANYTRHSFMPQRTVRVTTVETTRTESRDSTWAYGANEFNAYIENDWHASDKIRLNAGLHASLFDIDRRVKYGLSPRLSVSYRPMSQFAVKGSYARTTQYVHQLSQSYLSLPTDQWIPVTGKLKPQSADKIAAGLYWQTADNIFSFSIEAYCKWMHNLIDYRDEYYLKLPLEMWNARLTSGKGQSKGIDFKAEKQLGKVTGRISYSLAWSNRTFAEKNGGHTFPARFDNRHTINISLGWQISEKVRLNALWTGHSGNRFTLLKQMWQAPSFGNSYGYAEDEVPLKVRINNYRLPFYHRLDLSCTVKNSRGFWTFGIYNAYNHMNTVAIKRGYHESTTFTPTETIYESRPVFQKVKLLPIIPSIAYTWQF